MAADQTPASVTSSVPAALSCAHCGKPRPRKNAAYCSLECRDAAMSVELTEEHYRLVETLRAAGAHECTIQNELGVRSAATWHAMKKRDQALVEALAKGGAELHDKLVSVMVKRALDPKHPQGQLAGMFILNTTFGYAERKTVEHVGQVTVVLPRLSDEEREALLEVRRQRALQATNAIDAEVVRE